MAKKILIDTIEIVETIELADTTKTSDNAKYICNTPVLGNTLLTNTLVLGNTESNNESINLILDEENTQNTENIKNAKTKIYSLWCYVWVFILAYIGIFILVPILQLIYAYNFNNPIICNIRFTNGTLYKFVNDNTNIGAYNAIDFVIIDGICELVFQSLIIIIISNYKKFQSRTNILLITSFIILWINTFRYICFEIIFISYLIDLRNICTHNYISSSNIQSILNVSEIEDIIILRVVSGLLNWSLQCTIALIISAQCKIAFCNINRMMN